MNDKASGSSKGVSIYVVILIVLLAVMMTLLAVFVGLYFSEKAENKELTELSKVQTETQAQTQPKTEKQTEKETQKETKKQVEKTDTSSYTIKVYAPTAIYTGPGYGYRYVQDITEDGVYTIVDEHVNEYSETWGKLKSGLGWIEVNSATTDYSKEYKHYNYAFDYKDVPYTTKVYPVTEIHNAPTYNSEITGSIDEEGVYTIVEECYDENMNKWGKLKSGVGWILL